jgi:hypothetical protein
LAAQVNNDNVVQNFTATLINLKTLLYDDFNDGMFDTAKWMKSYTPSPGNAIPKQIGDIVLEEDGALKILEDATDYGGRVLSKQLIIDRTKPLIITCRTMVHYANEYMRGNQIGILEVDAAQDTIISRLGGVTHMNYFYNPDNRCIGSGFGVCGDTLLPPFWDQWVDEKLVYNPQTGITSYTLNDNETVTFKGSTPITGNTIRIDLSSYGWYTGHFLWIDWFKVEQ